MTVSLVFHIVFAVIGMTMPWLMVIAHGLWLKTGDKDYLTLTKTWTKGVAMFFAVGAASGTMLSFELGLLWPVFMEKAGPVIGMPFSWEGTAFFTEAIFLGLYLYGWDRLPPRIHWLCGLMVGIAGVTSGVFVVCANAWMNSPAGFDWVGGQAVNLDLWAAMFNPAWLSQTSHMTVAAFQAAGFGVAGVHAFLLLRGNRPALHKKAMLMALSLGTLAALIQPLSGDFSAKDVAKRQPLKLAAMEAHFHTEKGAGLYIGGIPDEKEQKVKWGIKLPGFLSFLAYGDFKAEVLGLNHFPREDWPPITITHLSFQIMVAIGGLTASVGALFWFIFFFKPTALLAPLFLRLLVLCAPLGFLAVEAGWFVTEVGRQPWVIYNIMRTSQAVTPMQGLIVPLVFFTSIYIMLSFLIVWLMGRQIKALGLTGGPEVTSA